ncbi:non-ribosomal peptide synthetase [Streptomyces naphthomycinicus]|uniref:non-ribosomal peptide synthetase n=1 Tax=Streptomyces naphthomycinicus TaxID=2872625 RepID=UPI001CEC45C5|nr:non-ribosomal peptide synthetase [Streptomyces sp. TML10]
MSGQDRRPAAPSLADARRALQGERARQRRRTSSGADATAAPSAAGPRPDAPPPLSYNQEQQWFLHQWESELPLYHVTLALRLAGPLDVPALARALTALVERHHILRTRYPETDGAAHPVVDPAPAGWPVPVTDLTAATPQEVERYVNALGDAPFDLATGPVLRAGLGRLAPERHVLVVVVHHIAFDGASFEVFARELIAHYTAARSGHSPELPPLPLQYADFARRQRARTQGGELDRQLAYWRTRLAGLPVVEVPADRRRPARPTSAGATAGLMLPRDLGAAVQELARSARVTPLTVYLAAFSALLSRYTDQDDIAVGSVFAGRNQAEVTGLIGYFANTLVLRTSTAGDPGFTELLRRTHETVVGAHLNQDLPYAHLVKELRPTRDGDEDLFRTCFTLHHAITESVEAGGLRIEPYPRTRDVTQFDLLVEVTEVVGEGVRLWAEYSTELFDPARIDRLLEHYATLLRALLAAPDTRLSAAPLLGPADEAELRAAGTGPVLPFPSAPPLVHQLFEEWAGRTPDAPALIMGDTTTTYRELDERADRLAGVLRAHGVGPDTVVGVLLDSRAELPTAVLGTMKAGGAYLPLDPAHSPELRRTTLERAGCVHVVTTAGRLDALPPGVTGVEVRPAAAPAASAAPPAPPTEPGHLAYVVFTSGSTGVPKGVQVPHAAAVAFVLGLSEGFALGPGDRMLQFASPTFDVSMYEMLGALCRGACLVQAERTTLLDPRASVALLRDQRVTALIATPAVLSLFDGADLPDLRRLKIGGEEVPAELCARWQAPGREVTIGYGPAETTVEATAGTAGDLAGEDVAPIGRPRPNYTVHVLDRHGRPTPPGVPGELHIGGVGLARGYLAQPGTTADRFRPNPFGPPGSRLYRTGDRVRLRSDGVLQFLGRVDRQVKIRGHRVELGEIEAALAAHPDIARAAVHVRTAADGDRELVAHVVPVAGAGDLTNERVRGHLLERVAAQVIPAQLLCVPELPLSAHGKVDRRSLAGAEIPVRTAPIPDTTLSGLFEAQAARTPGAPAVAVDDTRLDFAGLNGRANRLARLLVARGIGPERAVALLLPKTPAAIVALLAVWKAGGCYVPVDPDQPAERIKAVLAEADPALVLARADLASGLAGRGVPVLDPEDEAVLRELAAQPDSDLTDADRTSPPDPWNAAYIIYTSGSTGRPKGVVVTHRSAVNVFGSHSTELFGPAAAAAEGRQLGVAMAAPLSFDASVCGLLWLLAGHTVHLLDDGVRRDTAAFVAYVRRNRVDVVDVTPTHCAHLNAAGLLSPDHHRPHVVLLGGEAVPPALWRELRDTAGVLAHNMYGPTECTVDTTVAAFADSEQPVIGRAVPNVALRVLGPDLRPVPAGETGELCVAGAALARGYHHQPGLTAARFVPDPAGPPGARMYRTGDMVRMGPLGRLEFCGRGDDQVKIRGHRIELGEIEAALTGHPAVGQAAVIVREDEPGDQRVVAYLVPAPGQTLPDRAALREHAARLLSTAMRPAAYVELPALPLTRNAKLDRAALPAPDRGAASGGRAPRTPREAVLAALFAEVLQVDGVGVDDSFFDLGGHSLLATRLASRIRAALGVELPLRHLFEAPTVAALAAALDTAGSARAALRPVERPDRLPLSYAQTRLWFLNRLEGPGPTYNMTAALRLRGRLDQTALAAALGDLAGRHESLRTVFPDDDGLPRQLILPLASARPELVTREVAADDLADALLAASRTAFDVTRDAPLRAWLFRLGAEEHVVLLVLHHIACDGWSIRPLARDLVTAYAARSRGTEPGWRPLPVQYADYTLWQRELLGGEDDPDSILSGQVAHWRRALDGVPEELRLPADRPRPAVGDHHGGQFEMPVDAGLHAELLRLARDNGATLFMALQTALAMLLTKLGAGTDIPIGSPVAGRTDQALDDLVGFFANTLVLRIGTDGNPSFREALDRTRAGNLAAYSNQDVPFERLVELLAPARSLSRHPLFQVMLVLDNHDDGEIALPDVAIDFEPAPTGTAKFDLLINLTERGGADGAPAGLDLAVQYSRDLFDHDSAERLADRFVRLLRAAVAGPDLPLSDLDVLTPGERRAVAADWNDTAHEVPETTLTALFARQVARTPDAEAVRGAGLVLTYTELDAWSDRLARELIEHGAGPDRVVAIALPRSPLTIATVWAVLKTGAAYLPIDLDYPTARIAHMVSDAAPRLVVTDEATLPRLPEGVPVLRFDQDRYRPHTGRTPAPRIAGVSPDAPAYVLYTSGSTGRPKGVVLPHRALVNLLWDNLAQLPDGAAARVAQFSALGFDVLAHETFTAALSGGCLVVPDDDVRKDPERFVGWLRENRVNALFVPNLVLQAIARESNATPEGLPELRHIVHAGEALVLSHEVRTFSARHPLLRLQNHYGPSETHVATVHTLPPGGAGWPQEPPIGRPVFNTRCHVLDEWLRPVAPGVPGELYLAGAQLAHGYRNQPALTAERFVPDPFGPPGSRMYRTGDLVRWTRAGEIEFLGRVDHQVKIRGVRVEPGEIEAVLREHPGVAQAVVLPREAPAGAARLVAYVVPGRPGPAVETAALRERLRAALPEAMVPAAFVVLDELPRTANGKLDRAALPEPAQTEVPAVRRPLTAREEVVCSVIADVLGLPRVGVDDNFFALGGHSLTAAQTAGLLRRTLGVDLPVRALFEEPTAAGLAALAERSRPFTGPDLVRAEHREPLPLSHAQQRYWAMGQLADAGDTFHQVFALRLHGVLDAATLRASVEVVTERHYTLHSTVFADPDDGGAPRQARVPLPEDLLPVVDLSGLPAGAREEELSRLRTEHRIRPFPFGTGPLGRWLLVRLAEDEHVLLMAIHHLSLDGWSFGVLVRELVTLYGADGRAEALAPLPVSYADYVAWERAAWESGAFDRQLDHWRGRLAGLPRLRLGAPAAVPSSPQGATLVARVDAKVTDALRGLGNEHGASLYMTLLAALHVVVGRFTGQDDVHVGTPVAGRTRPELEGLIGCFVNHVILRSDLSGRPAFGELLDEVRADVLDAFDHQDAPLERVTREVDPGRDPITDPLFNIMLNVLNYEGASSGPDGLTVTPEPPSKTLAKRDLSLYVTEDPEGLSIDLVYRESALGADRARLFLSRYVDLLAEVAADPTRGIDTYLAGFGERTLPPQHGETRR